MSLRIENGAPQLSPAQIVAMSLQTTNENPIEFAASDVRGQSVSRDNPISRMRFTLRGDLVVTANGGTLSPLGTLNLIQNIQIARNGNQDIFNMPGKALEAVHRIETRHTTYKVEPGVTIATHPFVHTFEVRMDKGGYTSLLDATGDGSLRVDVTWGKLSDIYTGGAATLSNVKMDVVPVVIDGALPGERGGVGAGYFEQHARFNDQPVNQSQTDFRFDLLSGRGYHGLTLFSMSDGAMSDGIIKSVTLQRANKSNQRWEWDEIRAMNHDHYRLTGSEFTGVLDIPFVDDGHFEQTLSIRPSQSMRIVLDVLKPGTVDSVGLIQQYFRNPAS
jgi:hypothetical protein